MDWHTDRDPSVLSEQARKNPNLLYGGKPRRQAPAASGEVRGSIALAGSVPSSTKASLRRDPWAGSR